MRFRSSLFTALSLALALTAACGSDDGGGGRARADAGAGGADAGDGSAPDSGNGDASTPGPRPARALTGDCDPLVPEVCLLPFPSDVYRVTDATRPGGHRIELPAAKLPGATLPDVYRGSDGWSAAAAPMTYLPGATVTGLPTHLDLARSLEPSCPTVLLDAETGERIPHFAELDLSDPTSTPATRVLMIRPVRRLADDRRYVVAIRGVVDDTGAPIAPSATFAALRDGSSAGDAEVAAARPLYEHLFATLERAGVARGDLQIAWDFTTATRENNTRAMLHLRDDALADLPAAGPAFENLVITDAPDEHTARKIEGEIVVPLYLDQPGTGGVFVPGADGLPRRNGTARYPFLVLIPNSARTSPKPPLAIGHGLLGSRDQAEAFTAFADQSGYVLYALDWVGMASDDVLTIGGFLASGELHRFQAIADRLQQGFLNLLLATRMLTGGLATAPETALGGKPTIDPARAYYYGGSQGGIYGASVMGISTDFQRGVLAVPGQPYGLLLNRSVDFDAYLGILRGTVPNPIDIQVLLGLTQMLWDRAEPSGYSPYVRENLLPGTPAHEVLMIAALGDHQVNTLGAHIMARSIGAKLIRPAVRPVFELEEVDPPHRGSGLVELDFGNPPDPITNTPPREGQDPHGRAAEVPAMFELVDHFLKTGEVGHYCDGPCDPG
ncbi:MAG: hypothetical protein FJ104_07115 [Deltaproteobacteria bacterium]|nr:hypothetical protein [Deltaproteobacteria bacterium]